MKYVAGPEVVDLDEAGVAPALDVSADAAAERVVVVVDGDRVAGLLLEPDLEAAEARPPRCPGRRSSRRCP